MGGDLNPQRPKWGGDEVSKEAPKDSKPARTYPECRTIGRRSGEDDQHNIQHCERIHPDSRTQPVLTAMVYPGALKAAN